jgi:uncharacterized heparinase superfamily protein
MLVNRKVLHRSQTYRSLYLRRATGSERFSLLLFPDELYKAESFDLAEINENIFTFLNRRVCLGSPIDWLPQTETQLWKYNLHYFDYVPNMAWEYAHLDKDGAYDAFRRIVREWIEGCQVATPIAWDSYPISLRLSNWTKAYTLFAPALQEDDAFASELRRSLYIQAGFLENHLEYHLLGNHLIENGRALLLAGLFFKGRNAERWRLKGERLLWKELREQFLDDGGHYERSPMYHQIMLTLYQEVVAVLVAQGQIVPNWVKDRVEAMQDWLWSVLHPDGEIPLLNDAALGVAGNPNNLLNESNGLSTGLKEFPKSGYFVFRDSSKRSLAIFDCGAIGPDYQPGHGHCDTLGYELSLSGRRFIVDSGVESYYGDLEWRTYYRSTRAHNTLIVDGVEQSQIWSRFRVGRRAYPLDVQWEDKGPELVYACGSHSGYLHLSGNVLHRRWMCWIDRRFWLVCDLVTGRGRHQLESLIHFHPDIQIVSIPMSNGKEQVGEVRSGQTTLKIIPWGMREVATYFGETDQIQGWYAPEFGLRFKNHVWGLRQTDELPVWTGYILWPESTTPVLARSSSENNQSCYVTVQSKDAHYRIVINSKHISMEKKL